MRHFSNTDNSDTRRPRPVPTWSRRIRFAALSVLAALVLGLAPANAQETIDDAREDREATRISELRARAALDVLEAEFDDVQAAFDAADELVSLVEGRAASIEAQLKLAEGLLRRTEAGLAWAEYDRDQIDQELSDLAIRQYLGVSESPGLLSTDDLNAAQARSTVLDIVQGAGYDVIDTARSAAERHGELKEQAELELARVAELQSEFDEQIEEVEEAREVRKRVLDTLNAIRRDWTNKIDELEAEERRLTDFIRLEQRKVDIGEAVDAIQSSEGYVWPTAGGLGSYFGNRKHPVLGYVRLHGGIDIGGLMGQPIWAAKEGVVIMARVNGGYGNTIIVDHGNGFATLYAHQSSFVVSEGDYVETGQHIGNVGSTGLSTGPHLHFEVRRNGSVIDPLPFLPAR